MDRSDDTHVVTVITQDWLVPKPTWQVLVERYAKCYITLLIPTDKPGYPEELVVEYKDGKLMIPSLDITADDPESLQRAALAKRNIPADKYTAEYALLLDDQSLKSRRFNYIIEETARYFGEKFGAIEVYWIRLTDPPKSIRWRLKVKKIE